MLKQIALEESEDIVSARRVCRQMARDLGFGLADQTRLATATSEIARNAIQHAHGGRCTVRDRSNGKTAVISIVVEDDGPGIADVEKALKPGFSTSQGLGAGLPGARRLVHEFSISSSGAGTTVELVMRGQAR